MSARLIPAAAILLLAACSGGKDAAEPSGGVQGRPSAMGKDFALTSQSIVLPDDSAEEFPAGPNVELMNQDCRACHSPAMILTQPPLSHDEWKKEVEKMRGTFKAVVSDEDEAKILEYLDDFSAKQKPAIPEAAK